MFHLARPFVIPLLCVGFISCAQSQPQKTTSTAAKSAPYRAVIVSGGPSPDYNQYAIESNARYLEKVTAGALSRRILFADGSKTSRTISALEDRPDARSRSLFAYLFETNDDSQRETLRAPGLRQIDGPATKKSVLASVENLASEVKPGESALIYFTGHGSPGEKPRAGILAGLIGARTEPDFDNTSYALWKNEGLSTLELSAALKKLARQSASDARNGAVSRGWFRQPDVRGRWPQKPAVEPRFLRLFRHNGRPHGVGLHVSGR